MIQVICDKCGVNKDEMKDLRESEGRQESKALRERYGEYVMLRSPFGLHCGGGGSTGLPMQHGGRGKGTCMIPLVYEELERE